MLNHFADHNLCKTANFATKSNHFSNIVWYWSRFIFFYKEQLSNCFWRFSLHVFEIWKFSPIISHFCPFCLTLAFAKCPCSTTFQNLVIFWRLGILSSLLLVFFLFAFFLHRLTLMWLNGRSWYVFGTLESSPKQFTLIRSKTSYLY